MVGACSTTKPLVVEPSIAPPPASLMQPAPSLKHLEKDTPEEAIKVVIENYGLYTVISQRLEHLQEYVQGVLLGNPE